jgi:hypothetical protein
VILSCQNGGRNEAGEAGYATALSIEIELSSFPDMVVGMTTTRQRAYPEAVVKRLYALSGNRCAFPGCETRLTDQVAPGGPPTNLGKIAHIVGLGRQGPRADVAIPVADLNRIENLILLCGVHHDLVDANPRIYSVEVLAAYKANHEARIEGTSMPTLPPMTTETVDLSLLPITRLPERVWSAVPTRRTTVEIAAALPLPEQGEVLPFYLHAGRIHTFHDLTAPKGPFRGLIEHTTIDEVAQADLLAKPDRRVVFVRLLNKALDRSLRARGVRFDREHRRYYFLADHETIGRSVIYKTKTGRKLSRKVVRQEGERTTPRDVWWHLAARIAFEQFTSNQWGLTLRPEFHLTTDGTIPLASWRIGPRVTRKKSRIYNEAYFDAVHFWRHYLTEGQPRLIIKAGQAIIAAGDFPTGQARWPHVDDETFQPVGVPDDDLLTLLAEQAALAEDDWGAEYEDEEGDEGEDA